MRVLDSSFHLLRSLWRSPIFLRLSRRYSRYLLFSATLNGISKGFFIFAAIGFGLIYLPNIFLLVIIFKSDGPWPLASQCVVLDLEPPLLHLWPHGSRAKQHGGT